MIVAGLDFGTNTFLCLIADIGPSHFKVLSDQVQMVRLGQGVDQTKRFHPDALARARAALESFQPAIQKFKPERLFAVATSASRDVENKDELIRLCQEFKIPMAIIPGEREAELTYRGALSGLNNRETAAKSFFVIDVGGGSTEYVFGDQQKIQIRQSLNMGCVRMIEAWHSKPPLKNVRELRLKFGNLLQTEFASWDLTTLRDAYGLAVAGTPTEIARVEICSRKNFAKGTFPIEEIEKVILDEALLNDWLERLSSHSPEQLTQTYGVDPKRADVLFSGCLILLESLQFFGLPGFHVSTRGLRYGVVLDLYHVYGRDEPVSKRIES